MTDFVYVPILRWKQGEQGALSYTDAADRQRMLPIAEIQAIESTATQPKLQRQMLRSGGTQYPIGIDFSEAISGLVPHALLADRCKRLQSAGVHAWPTIRTTHAIADLPGLAHFKGQPAVIVRSRAESTPLADVTLVIDALRKVCGKHTPIYVVLDLFALADVDPNVKAVGVAPQAQAVLAMSSVTQVAVAGGSFPMNLGALKPGVGNRLMRRELAVWKALRALPGCGAIVFGDYGVTNPEPLEEIDPTKMNPAAGIRYTLKDVWWVLRGSGVRTKGKGGMGQYNGLCKLLIASPDYSGATFSYGDKKYYDHAQPKATSGSLTTWRRDATNHHVVFTVRQMISGNVMSGL